MEPNDIPTQSLFGLLNAITGLLSKYFTAHPGVYDTVVGGFAFAFLYAVFLIIQKQATNRFWSVVGWLGSIRGLSNLAWWAYRSNLVGKYGKLVNIYLGKEEELTLRQIFVPLTLRVSGHANLDENRSTEQILSDPEQKRLVLLGAPGSGKSTLLKALAAGISRREWPQFGDLQPVLASLREYAHAVEKKSLFDWLTEDELPRFGLLNPKPLLKAMLDKGQVLIMLDGLDEVANDKLEVVNRAISAFLDDLDKQKGCRVLLTCREQNYDELPDRYHYIRDGFAEYRVAELSDSEIREIVRRRQYSFIDKQKSMANYLDQVFRHADILQLHRNPLLLTLSMGVYLHKPGEDVPHNLAQFYEQAIDNLLRRHDFREVVGGRSANHFKAECKFRLLRQFALHNLIEATQENRDFETFSFQGVTEAARQLAEQGIVDFKPDEAHAVVKEIQMQAGLLNALQDGECFLFAHRSLNEYCAAAALNRQNQVSFEQIFEQLGNTAWRQVIFFYAAINDDNNNAVQLVEAIKLRAERENDLHLLALAGHCAAVMVQPRPQLRLELLGALTEALLASDLAMRGVLLKSLLALGNSRDEAIRQRLDDALRKFVESGHADALITEVGRLEPDVALQFLGYLTDSEELERKRSALNGLWALKEQDKIPYVWRLLLAFRAAEDTPRAGNALVQLLDLINEPGAVERLNDCESKPANADKAQLQQLFKIYPFQSESKPVSNFAWLLTWAAESGLFTPQTVAVVSNWQRFFDLILISKTAKELREWQRLPRDKNKWTSKIQTLVLGRLLFGLSLSLGFVLMLLMFWLITNPITIPITISFPFPKLALLSLIFLGMVLLDFCLGIIVLPVWKGWKYILNRWRKLGTLKVFPQSINSNGNQKPSLQSATYSRFFRMLQHISLGLVRLFIFGWAILLLGVAAFLNHPSISGHSIVITSLSTAPSMLLTGSFDATARLWDGKTGIELRWFPGDTTVRAVAFAQDKLAVLVGSSNNSVKLLDITSGFERLRTQLPDDSLNMGQVQAFAPNGATILAGSWDGRARLWDSKTGLELKEFRQDDSAVRAVAISADGLSVLTGSSDGMARLWDSKTGVVLKKFRQGNSSVQAVAISADGLSVLTGSSDGMVRLWNSKTGVVLKEFRQDDNSNSVNAVAFSADGLSILTGSSDNTARLWNSKTGEKMLCLQHNDTVSAVAFTPDGLGIYTGSDDGAVRLWNRKNGELLWETPRPFWNPSTWSVRIIYIWFALIFLVFFLPCLNWFDRGRVWYLRKPNRYIHLYQIPGVERWLPPEEKE